MTVRHSIIIPHRNRERYLSACTASIERSAQETGRRDYEIVLCGQRQVGVFNKSAALNEGIARARGEVFTFLDCDALVPARWLAAVHMIDLLHISRLCYRVRYATRLQSQAVLDNVLSTDELWRQYDQLRLGYEAWGNPLSKAPRHDRQPWGNSQFSIHRRTLGEQRFDERYIGRGFEDLAFLREMHDRLGPSYRGAMMGTGEYGLIHLMHDYQPDWRTPAMDDMNLKLFRAGRRS